MFIEKKMEMIPKLTRSDLEIARKEFRRVPLIVGLVFAAVLGIVFFIYLLHVLPAPVVFIIVVLLPAILFFRWVMKL